MQVKDARRTLKCPQVDKFDAAEHKTGFWCYCCEVEVQKHVTDGRVTVLYGGLLEHMSTQEHRKNTNTFWWKNKADPKHKEKFIITEQESDRFKEEVAKALEQYEEKEDTLIKEQAAFIRSQEQHRLEVLQALIEPDPELQQSADPEQQDIQQTISMGSEQTGRFRTVLNEQPGPSRSDPFVGKWDDSGQGLTFIGHQDCPAIGNIHTGAVPPWLLEDPKDETAVTSQDIGPSLQDFLKHKEQQKLKRLPANRVGANFDHSSHTGADWLPSFGRVWNSGRRWQSRHQFRQEEAKSGQKRRKELGGKAAKKQKHLTNGDV
ncbi:coiled-coil domain-containing protein 84 isoform X2 [Tachysurus ichikawai]